MGVEKLKEEEEVVVVEEELSHKGTVFSVSVVGVVILLTWVGVFALYMARI